MAEQIFREGAVDRITSPEKINDYIHVTTPQVWVTIAMVILVIVGGLIWAGMTTIDSYITGNAEVSGGVMTVTVDESENIAELAPGMQVRVGDTRAVIANIGTNRDGDAFATMQTTLPDGIYEAQISYSETQLLELLFN